MRVNKFLVLFFLAIFLPLSANASEKKDLDLSETENFIGHLKSIVQNRQNYHEIVLDIMKDKELELNDKVKFAENFNVETLELFSQKRPEYSKESVKKLYLSKNKNLITLNYGIWKYFGNSIDDYSNLTNNQVQDYVQHFICEMTQNLRLTLNDFVLDTLNPFAKKYILEETTMMLGILDFLRQHLEEHDSKNICYFPCELLKLNNNQITIGYYSNLFSSQDFCRTEFYKF